jgi:aldehyde:ferredoxin oxidoreductase
MGSMLGGSDVSGMLQLLDEAEVQGLDVMSAGVVLAWATEALEQGVISSQETDGLELSWGNYPVYIEAVKRIVSQPNDFYRALARGVEHAASSYGGQDFALAFGGNEMPGYHTGPACHLGYLTGARHSHLDSAGYSLDQKKGVSAQTLTPESVAEALLAEERWRQVLTSLVICLFARGIYTPEVVQKTLATVGFEWSLEELEQLSLETLRLKHDFKTREGFELTQLRLPRRIFETPAPAGKFDEDFMRQTMAHFAEKL